MEKLVSFVSTIAAILSAFAFAILGSCGTSPQTPASSVITFNGAKLVHHQRETITASVQPVLSGKEFLQIWVRADDQQWYPCESAKKETGSGAWKAICQFGSDRHPAAEGAQFVLGAFYTTDRVNAEYLPDSLWYLLKTQQTQPVTFSRSN